MAASENKGIELTTAMGGLYLDGITKFSGDDTESSSKWAQDLEDNAAIFDWTPQQKLVFARRSLTGTAGLWLKSEKVFRTYDELKTAVLKEFPDTMNTKEVHEIMSARKKQRNETFYEYMLIMRELGRKAKFPDYVIVQYVIDGIIDYEPNKSILYGATTFPVLKERLQLYEKMKNKAKTTSETQAKKSKPQLQQRMNRCYNCGETDHVANKCRKGIKCFRCNNYGHIGKQCPKINDQVASVKQHSKMLPSEGATARTPSVKQRSANFNMDVTSDSVDFDNQTSHERNEVMQIENKGRNSSTKPMIMVKIENLSVNALIDSGSDFNLMSHQCFVAIGAEKYEDNLNLTGLGRTIVNSLGKVYLDITIDGKNYNNVLFHIVNSDAMPFDMILGQELLQKLTMIMSGYKVKFLSERDEWMSKLCCFSDSTVEVDHIVNPAVRGKVLQCIEDYNPTQIKDAPIELKIVLKDDVPVAQRPRRLSLMEQKIVEQQVKEWLEDGVIQQKTKNKQSNDFSLC
ncbi:uncharacterized protein LOC126378416 [Pectinophora gossypiella]|uniref:uncharacterized protein LOC126369232 n=1 Tax=Pectinophora gossypiella TaxID=13191 RepID=UPI00214F3B0E|nr:uncharacterized protein LOC126369232 [Pectinophora gossypiella]XP_049882722.1 uncharacterized protein LOC126378416 [Pectinophora gossypiella]